MDTVQDFEDVLALLHRHHVRYLIIGGLAFIFHAKPRYTKDVDLWIDPERGNVERANQALAAFGSLRGAGSWPQRLPPESPSPRAGGR